MAGGSGRTSFETASTREIGIAVAVGWQVYAIRRNPLDLGLIGLAEFIPLPLLALPAGQLADRMSRRRLASIALIINIAVVLLLLVVTANGADELWPFFALPPRTVSQARSAGPHSML